MSYFSSFWANLGPRSLLAYFFYCGTNLRPIVIELIVKHIIHPQCCNSRILEDMTEIYIIGPTIKLKYQENVGLRNKRGVLLASTTAICFHFKWSGIQILNVI